MTDARARLAQAQAELLRALLADGPIPEGFDAERLSIEKRALLAKRRGVAAMLGPTIVDELGERFRPLFDTYATTHPRLAGSRARDDVAGFAEWARERGELAPAPKRRRWWPRRQT